MSQIYLINNVLDETEYEIIESENVFIDFLNIRKTHPQARIYLGEPCPENDITPTSDSKESIQRIIDLKEKCTVVCVAGKSALKWVFAAPLMVGLKTIDYALSYFVPKVGSYNNGEQVTGSSNNNLSNPSNKQRIKERPPYIIGGVKAVADLYAPPYRYFVDGVEVEETLMNLCENHVVVSQFKEGDTPIEEITGKSLTAYGLNQNITGSQNIYTIGDAFTEAPLIVKQSSSINGQTLISPNSTKIERNDIYFVYPNKIMTTGAVDFEKFTVGDNIIIDGANFGIADLAVTGLTTIDYTLKTLTIQSGQTVVDYQNYRKINITSMLVTDPENGQLDLAGLYDISSITYSGGYYTIQLSNPSSTNANFTRLTEDVTVNVSGNLTANTANIFLDGSYTITGIDSPTKTMTLATPSTVNPDWTKLDGLFDKKTPVALIRLRGSQENYIGWFTIDSQQATGLLLNFKASNGIYQGSTAKTAVIEAQYQRVVNGNPVGQVYTESITLTGKANNRDSVGGSLWVNLPFSGSFRFRARRVNDNGEAQDLVDEVKFYQANAYHRLQKLVYDNRVIIRQKTIATPNATSQESRQLNCIAESLVYSYRGGIRSANRIKSRNIADLTIDLALNPKIGRRNENEIDFNRIYQAVDEITEYFGSAKMAEFNWTLDKTNTSFEELMRVIAAATCSHDRRVNRKIYYDLESANNDPIILFNHRNKKVKTESRGYNFRNNNDGVEITYVDSENGWVEKILRVPNEAITNPKKIDGTGIVYKQQAHIVAWREWNKLEFSRVSSTFTAYCESDLVFRGDCVLNTDDTRIDNTSSGEILAWVGDTVVGSQPFEFTSNNLIHLQLKSGAIDVIPISAGVDEFTFKLRYPPSEALVVDGQVKTAYSITTEATSKDQRFLVTKKDPSDVFENVVTLSNFDERFYRNDKDIINGRI